MDLKTLYASFKKMTQSTNGKTLVSQCPEPLSFLSGDLIRFACLLKKMKITKLWSSI